MALNKNNVIRGPQDQRIKLYQLDAVKATAPTLNDSGPSITGSLEHIAYIDESGGAGTETLKVYNSGSWRTVGLGSLTGTISVGSSGTAGAFTLYPATASKGTFWVYATNNTSNKYLKLTNATVVAQDTVITIPDPGVAAAQVVLTNAAYKCLIATGAADRTITLTGDLTRVGAHALTLTTGATTDVTLPSTGTLATLGGSESLDTKTLTNAGAITQTGAVTITSGTTGIVIPDANTAGLAIHAASGKGYVQFKAVDSTGDTATVIQNALQGGARTYSIPDAGNSAGSFAMSDSVNMAKFVIGAARTLTLGGNIATAGDVTFTGAFAASFTIPSASTWAFPTGGGTLALATGAETGTNAETFTVDQDSAAARIALSSNSATGNFVLTLVPPNLSASYTVTVPGATDTLVNLTSAQTLTTKTLTAPVVNGMTTAAAANNFTLNTGSGAFTTPSGTFTFYSSTITRSGNPIFDFSGSSGVFYTSTGENILYGNVTINGTKTFASGTGTFTVNGAMTISGVNTLTTGTGALVLKGSGTFDATKTLTFGAGAGGTAEPILMYSATGSNGSFAIACCNGATNSKTTLTNVDCAAAAVISLPNATSTLATVGLAETFSGVKTFSAAPAIQITNAANNDVRDALEIERITSAGGHGANNIGVGVVFSLEEVGGTHPEVAALDVVATDATLVSLDADWVFSTMKAGTEAEVMRIDPHNATLKVGKSGGSGITKLQVFSGTTTRGSIILSVTDHASADTSTTITNATDSAAPVVVTLPNATGTLATLGVAETFSAVKTFSVQPIVLIDDATNNAVTDCLRLTHTTSGVSTAGIGVGLPFYVEDAGGSEEQGSIDVSLATVTDGSEDADMVFSLNLRGDMTQVMKVDSVNQAVVIGVNASDADGIASLWLFPLTQDKGKLVFTATANTGDSVTTITNAAQGGAYTYTIPNAGGSKYFAMTATAAGTTSRADITEESLMRYQLPLQEWRNLNGTVMDATGAATAFKIVNGGIAAGTLTLTGNEADGATITSTMCKEFVMPPEYIANADVKVIVNCKYLSANTPDHTTHTVDVVVYEVADDGTAAAILASSAQEITSSFADYTFVVTDTNLTAGDRIMIYVQMVMTEGGGSVGQMTATIGSVEVQADIQG